MEKKRGYFNGTTTTWTAAGSSIYVCMSRVVVNGAVAEKNRCRYPEFAWLLGIFCGELAPHMFLRPIADLYVPCILQLRAVATGEEPRA